MIMHELDVAIDLVVSVSADSVIGQFDQAVGFAKGLAIGRFGVTEEGNFTNVRGAERSECVINVEFVSFKAIGGMLGWNHQFVFKAWVSCERLDDDFS